jgi:hypothetical protein
MRAQPAPADFLRTVVGCGGAGVLGRSHDQAGRRECPIIADPGEDKNGATHLAERSRRTFRFETGAIERNNSSSGAWLSLSHCLHLSDALDALYDTRHG